MSGSVPLAPLLITLPFLVFWVWMFRDMLNNPSILPNARMLWLLGFIFVGILTAGYYYFTEYRPHQ